MTLEYSGLEEMRRKSGPTSRLLAGLVVQTTEKGGQEERGGDVSAGRLQHPRERCLADCYRPGLADARPRGACGLRQDPGPQNI